MINHSSAPSLCGHSSSMQTIRGAGHYVYADQPDDFNQRVLQVCDEVDWPDMERWTLEEMWVTTSAATAEAHREDPMATRRKLE